MTPGPTTHQKLEDVTRLLSAQGVDIASLLKESEKGGLTDETKKWIDVLYNEGSTLHEYLTRLELGKLEGREPGKETIALKEPANVLLSVGLKIAGLKANDDVYRSDLADSVASAYDADFAETIRITPVSEIRSLLEDYASINPNGSEGELIVGRRLNPSEKYECLSKLLSEKRLGKTERAELEESLEKFSPGQLKYMDPAEFDKELDYLSNESRNLKEKNRGKGELAAYITELRNEKVVEYRIPFAKPQVDEPEQSPAAEQKPAQAAAASTATDEATLDSLLEGALLGANYKAYRGVFKNEKGQDVQINGSGLLVEDPSGRKSYIIVKAVE